MSRITGADAKSLMEAYGAVYTPQELTEEQVWEGVGEWVNALLEEGYDLSEYTWEDMYEHYLDEAIGQPGSAGMVNWQDKNNGQVRSGYKSSSDGKLYKNHNDALAAKNSRMGALGLQQGFQRTYRAGGGDAAVAGSPSRPAQGPLAVMAQGATNLQRQQQRPAQAPATRPAAPAATPAARPAAPAARPAAPAATPAAKAAPAAAAPSTAATGFKLAQQGVNLAQSNKTAPTAAAAPSTAATGFKLAQQGVNLAQSNKTAPTAAPAPKPAAPGAGKEYLMRKQLNQDLDLFDIIKGHLIDEGYADTEESATVIMANMSEEWRQSIVEQSKQNYRSYDGRDRGGSAEDHEKKLKLQDLIRSVQGNSVKKSG